MIFNADIKKNSMNLEADCDMKRRSELSWPVEDEGDLL